MLARAARASKWAAWLRALLCLLGAVALHATPVRLAQVQDRMLLSGWVDVLDDGSAPTLADALRQSAAFKPLTARHPTLWARGHWLRFSLHNGTPAPGEWLLSLGVPDTELLEVYRVDAGSPRALLSLGPDAPFAARTVPHRLLAVPFGLAADETGEFYLHYRTHGDTPLRLEVFTPPGFSQQLASGNFANGVVIGILIALLVFALMQYAALRVPANLFYVAMAAQIILFVSQIEGYNFKFLWPGAGRWNQYAPTALIAGVYLTHAAFSVSLFNMRQRIPVIFRCYVAFAVLVLPCMVAYWITGEMAPLYLLSLCYVPLPLLGGLAALRRQMPAAGFFLAGSISLAFFVNILFSAGVSGLIEYQAVSPFLFPKLGYLCEAMLFSAALAYRIHTLHQRHAANLRHRLAEAEQLVQAESARNRALEAARQQQMQLAAAGHDLSQPLASIRFAIAALRAQSGNDSTTGHIDKALDYTESLLRGLIDDAKQGIREQTRQVDLGEVLADAHERHLAAARQKGLQLRYQFSSATVQASRLVLERLLDNLVSNAIRYTDRGTVLLGVRHRAAGIEIQVVDTGHGFDTAQRERLLAPFSQSGNLPAEQLGHGLGLHIVHALCEQAGYTLTIRSVRGRGSVFGIVIPHGSGQLF